MNHLKQQLLAGDPLAREAELAAADVLRIWQTVLLEARSQPVTTQNGWLGTLLVAGTVAACLLLAVAIGMRLDVGGRPVAPHPVAATPARQMQFAAPGGTRIIWTFHQELDL